MPAAVGSASAAPYVAPSPDVSPASSADAPSTTAAAATSSAAAPLPAGSPALSDGTVAALVAQQAADTDPAAGPAPSNTGATADHVQIPATVLANMQAFETTAKTAYSDQIAQYAATINDAKASDQDRLTAWTSLTGMLTSGTVYKAGNLSDFQTALDATQTSSYAKSLMTLEDQFHSRNVVDVDTEKAKGQAGVQGLMDAFNSYSDADQQKIFVLMGMNQSYSDLATMKADYQNVADIYAATGQLTKATMQLSASSGGQAGAGASDKAAAAGPSQAAPASATPSDGPAPAPDDGTAVALKTLQSISDQLTAARKGDDDGGILSLFDQKPTTSQDGAPSKTDASPSGGSQAAA